MDSPFDHVCDGVVREGDYVRTLSVAEQQAYDHKQEVIQKRAAAYLRDTPGKNKKQPTKAKLNTSAPAKVGGGGGQSNGYSSSISVGERLGIDMGSVDSCWHSLTAGTWLGYKDSPICFGTVLSVNVPNKLVLVSIWREGDTAFTHIKKPLKMFQLHTLKKLSGQEFSKECKRKVVNRLQQELRMRQDGMEVGAPFALTTFNNRVVNELLDTALGGEEEWESQRISGILQSLGRIKDEHGSTMTANDTNQQSHLAHSPYNIRDVADGLSRSALASRGGSASYASSGGGVPSKRGARLGGSSRAHSALSDRPGSRFSGNESRTPTTKEAPRRPLRMKDIRRIPPRGPAAYLNDPLPIIQPIVDPFHSIRRSATEFANAGMQIKSQLDLPYTHSDEDDEDEEGTVGEGGSSMSQSTSGIPLPTLEHDNSVSSNSVSQPPHSHNAINGNMLNVSRRGGGGQSVASSNLSLGESRDHTPRTDRASIKMLNVNGPADGGNRSLAASRGVSPMEPSLQLSRGGNSSTPRSTPATSRLVTPRAIHGATYATATLAPTLLSASSLSLAEVSSITTTAPSPPTRGDSRLNGVTSNNGMQNSLQAARYELDVSLHERVRNQSSPVRRPQLDNGGLHSNSALVAADPALTEPLRGAEAAGRIPVSRVGRLLLTGDGQEESLAPQSSQHKTKPALSPPIALVATHPTVSCEDFGDNLSEAGSSSSSCASPLLPGGSSSSNAPPPPPQFMPINAEEESILDGIVHLRDGGGNGGCMLLIAPSSDSIAATKDDLFSEPFPPFEATLAFIQMWAPPPSTTASNKPDGASMPNRRRKVSMISGGGLEDGGGDGYGGGGFARRVLSMDTSQRTQNNSEAVTARIQALLHPYNPTSRGDGGLRVINTGLLHPTTQALEVVLMRNPISYSPPDDIYSNSRSRSASASFQSKRVMGFGDGFGGGSYRMNADFGACSFMGGPPVDGTRRLTVAPITPSLIDFATLGVDDDAAPSTSLEKNADIIVSRVESTQPTGSASRALSSRSAPSASVSSSIVQEQLVSEGLAWVRVSPALQALAYRALPVDSSFADDTAAQNKSSTMLMRSNTILGSLSRRMSMGGGAFGQQIKNAPSPQQQQSPMAMMGRGAKAAAALRESRNGASGAIPLTTNEKRIWAEYSPLIIRLLQRQREAQKDRRGMWYYVQNSLNSALGGIPGGTVGAAPSLSHLLLSMGDVGAQQQLTSEPTNNLHQRPLSAQLGRLEFHQQSGTPSRGPRLQSILMAGSASSSTSNIPMTTPVVTPSAQSLNAAVEEQPPTLALQQLLRSSAAGALDVLLGPQSGLPEGAAMDELFDLWEAALQS